VLALAVVAVCGTVNAEKWVPRESLTQLVYDNDAIEVQQSNSYMIQTDQYDSILLTPDGYNLYAFNQPTNTLYAFRVNSETGQLSSIRTIPLPTSQSNWIYTPPRTYDITVPHSSMRLSPDGRYLFLAVNGDNPVIHVFSRESSGSVVFGWNLWCGTLVGQEDCTMQNNFAYYLNQDNGFPTPALSISMEFGPDNNLYLFPIANQFLQNWPSCGTTYWTLQLDWTAIDTSIFSGISTGGTTLLPATSSAVTTSGIVVSTPSLQQDCRTVDAGAVPVGQASLTLMAPIGGGSSPAVTQSQTSCLALFAEGGDTNSGYPQQSPVMCSLGALKSSPDGMFVYSTQRSYANLQGNQLVVFSASDPNLSPVQSILVTPRNLDYIEHVSWLAAELAATGQVQSDESFYPFFIKDICVTASYLFAATEQRIEPLIDRGQAQTANYSARFPNWFTQPIADSQISSSMMSWCTLAIHPAAS